MRRLISFLLAIASLLLTPPTRAQNPAHLEVTTTSGASTFHLGERIPLTLSFTAPPEAKLSLWMATYDRSGRMNYETFDVSPSGSTDPLAAYLASSSTMSGGLSSGPAQLSRTPTTVQLDLNEWVRFDKPGDYTVTVHSARVLPAHKEEHDSATLPITSNWLKLHIIPATPAWQKAKLAAALQALSKPTQPFAAPSSEITAAIADLRYLASPAVVPILATGLDQDDRAGDFALGLIGLPPSLHDLAVRTLRQGLEDPKVPVRGWFIGTLQALEADSSNTDIATAWEARTAALRSLTDTVSAALPRKEPHAQALTADALLREYTGVLSPTAKAIIAAALAPNLSELPEQNQAILLGSLWDALRPAISPQTLEHLATLPLANPADHSIDKYNRLGLKSIALRRWYELAPMAATQAAYAQIGSATPSLSSHSLWFLPSEPLPQFEPIWAEALLSRKAKVDPVILASFMTRFGTGSYASEIAALVQSSLDAFDCDTQSAMLAYVVKFRPESARPLLQQVFTSRKTGCYKHLFEELSAYTNPDMLTTAAIDAVDDPDPEAAAGAVRYLTDFSDSRALGPILKRYRAWTAAWAGRAENLEPDTPSSDKDNWGEYALGQNLGQALLSGEGWIADEPLRAEVLSRCVGRLMCSQLQRVAAEAIQPYNVNLYASDGTREVHIGPYTARNIDMLERKLSQFPPGATFILTDADLSSDARTLEGQVRAAFKAADFSLQQSPPPQP